MGNQELSIRAANSNDFDQIWEFMEPILKAGDTYPYDPDSSKEEAYDIWFASEKKVYVAELDSKVVGTYYMRDNQPCLSSHIANAGYMVHPGFGGQGIGKAMGKHSFDEAQKFGYTAMQFNLVVADNIASIKIWEKYGFQIIGTVPKAFKSKSSGLLDAHIMHKEF